MAYTYIFPDGVVDDGVVRSTTGTNVTAVFGLPDIDPENNNLAGSPVRVVSSISVNSGSYSTYSWNNTAKTMTLASPTSVSFKGIDDGTPTTVSMYTDSGSTFIRYYYGICGSLQWYTVPTAPQTFTAVRTGSDLSSIVVTLTSGSISDGGNAIIRYAADLDQGFGYGTNRTLVSNTTTYTGLDPKVQHKVRVYAQNAAGYSQATEVTIPAIPGTPTGLTTTPNASVSGRIDLSWTAATPLNGTLVGYEIYKDGSLLTTTSGSGVTYADTGNDVGSSHLYYLRTKITNTVTLYSLPTAAVSGTAPGVSSAPIIVSATPSTETPGLVTLTWTPPVTNYGDIIDYSIYADGSLTNTVSGSTLTADVTGLNYNQVYTFTMKARNQWAIDNSLYSPLSIGVLATAPGEEVLPLSAFFRKSLRIIPTSSGNNSYAAPTGDLASGVFRYGMEAGETYTAVATCRLAAPLQGTLHELSRKIVVVQNGGTVVASSDSASNAAGVTQLRVTFTIPEDATAATVRLYNGASENNGDVWWDQFAIIAGTYTDSYFDGSSTDLWPNTYAWSGTENNSTSTKAVDTVNSVIDQPILSPYGKAGRADSQATLEIKYRSGWIG